MEPEVTEDLPVSEVNRFKLYDYRVGRLANKDVLTLDEDLPENVALSTHFSSRGYHYYNVPPPFQQRLLLRRIYRTRYGTDLPPDDPIKYLNENNSAMGDRLFLDIEDMDAIPEKERDALFDRIMAYVRMQLSRIFSSSSQRKFPWSHCYVVLRKARIFRNVDNNNPNGEPEVQFIPGRYHVVFPFMIMSRNSQDRLLEFLFKKDALGRQFSGFIDYKATHRGRLRMPLMKKWNAVELIDETGVYIADSFYNPQGEHFDNASIRLPFDPKQFTVDMDPNNMSEVHEYLSTIRAYPGQNTSYWAPTIVNEYARMLGAETSVSRNAALRRSLIIENESDDEKNLKFFENNDVFNFDTLLQILEDKAGYEGENDDHHSSPIVVQEIVNYCNRFWVVLTNLSSVFVASKIMKNEEGRPIVDFDIKKRRDFLDLFENKSVWVPTNNIYKGRKVSDLFVYMPIAKIWLLHPSRNDRTLLTYNPFPEDHPEASHYPELNLFRDTIMSLEEVRGVQWPAEFYLDIMWRIFNRQERPFWRTLNFMTHKRWKPWKKIGFVPTFVGDQGVGKSLLIKVFLKIFGINAMSCKPALLFSKGNILLRNKLLINIDEPDKEEVKQYKGSLKALITNEGKNVFVEQKFRDVENNPNCIDVLWSTDSSDNVLKEKNDRRFFMINCVEPYEWETAEQRNKFWAWMNETWFYGDDIPFTYSGAKTLADWLTSETRIEAMLKSGFRPYMDVQNDTTFDSLQEGLSLNSAEAWIEEMIDTGMNWNCQDEHDWFNTCQYRWRTTVNVVDDPLASQQQDESARITVVHIPNKIFVRGIEDTHGNTSWEENGEQLHEMKERAGWLGNFCDGWVRFLTQERLKTSYQIYCDDHFEEPEPWRTVKMALSKRQLGDFTTNRKCSMTDSRTGRKIIKTFYSFHPLQMVIRYREISRRPIPLEGSHQELNRILDDTPENKKPMGVRYQESEFYKTGDLAGWLIANKYYLPTEQNANDSDDGTPPQESPDDDDLVITPQVLRPRPMQVEDEGPQPIPNPPPLPPRNRCPVCHTWIKYEIEEIHLRNGYVVCSPQCEERVVCATMISCGYHPNCTSLVSRVTGISGDQGKRYCSRYCFRMAEPSFEDKTEENILNEDDEDTVHNEEMDQE